MQPLLNKYRTHDLLPTNYRTIVAPNNRIARTYHKHNTRPQTKYKQHTPYQIQNYCIATIQQIQNNVGKTTHILYSIPNTELLYCFYTPNTEQWGKTTHILYFIPNTEKRILLHQIQKNGYQIQKQIQLEHCSIKNVRIGTEICTV